MDTLANEIVTHILSYIKGEDVLKLKFLNYRCRQILEKNRDTFQYPLYGMTIENVDMLTEKSFNIHLLGQWSCEVDYSDKNSVIITPLIEKQRFNSCAKRGIPRRSSLKFFKPFFDVKQRDHSLETMFQYLFEKINIDDLNVNNLEDTECLSKITAVIERNSVPVREVIYTLDSPRFPLICKLLTLVGNHEIKGKDFPRMTFHFNDIWNFSKSWTNFQKVNEIASTFKRSLCSCDFHQPLYLIPLIANAWVEDPFPKFNFDLRIEAERKPTPFELRNTHWRFEVTVTNGDFMRFHPIEREFLFFDPEKDSYPEYQDSSVELRDKIRRNSLFLKKRIGSKIKTVEMSIDARIIV